jgi:hypothetical protein
LAIWKESAADFPVLAVPEFFRNFSGTCEPNPVSVGITTVSFEFNSQCKEALKMGQEGTCNWCGEWIYFISRDGRNTAMQCRDRKQHRCRDSAIGSRFTAPSAKFEHPTRSKSVSGPVPHVSLWDSPENSSSRSGLATSLTLFAGILILLALAVCWL